MGPLISYSDKFYKILLQIDDRVSKKLIEIETDPTVKNGLNIEEVDVSNTDWNLSVKISGKVKPIKVASFLRYFFPNVYSNKEIQQFSINYNRVKKGLGVIVSKQQKSNVTKIEVPEFSFNPKDVRATFLSLVTETYPHPEEEGVVKYISGANLTKDAFGNYYKIIGKSDTMFTSHLDTADRKKSKVSLYSEIRDKTEYIFTGGDTILGADDKGGVTVMLYMIAHNIPGVYYFFIGEEVGGIGSSKVSVEFDNTPHLKDIKRCVSFDRRDNDSVITSQMYVDCCSAEFAQALCDSYNKHGLGLKPDATGVYTDSASFLEQIRECTNVSIGYMHEHTVSEYQDMTFLIKLCEVSILIDWDSLPVVRKIGFDEDIQLKYSEFISDIKACAFNMDPKFVTEYGISYVKMQMDEVNVDLVHDDFLNIVQILKQNKMDPDILFEDDYIKIELTL